MVWHLKKRNKFDATIISFYYFSCICCGCFVCASACADGTDQTVHRCPKCDKFIGCAGDNIPRTNSTLQSPTSRSNNNEIRSDCNQISPQQNQTIAPSQTIVIVPPNSHSADDNPPSYFEATSQPQFDLD